MNRFLIITQNPNSQWLISAKKLLGNLGGLETISNQDALTEIDRIKYDLILIDSIGIKDIVILITLLRSHLSRTPILVLMSERRWRWAREVIRAGATDCILKSSSPEKLLNIIMNSLNNVNPHAFNKKYPSSGDVILFADNDPDFVKTRSEFLERAGYSVINSTNSLETKQKLETGGIDLAVIDIRLENDDDEMDLSGLALAQNYARAIPKVILTDFPTFDYVRDALRPQLDGLPAAVDFVHKREGPTALLETIQDILRTSSKQDSQVESKVFIAHGQDWETRDGVAKYLEEIGITPLILFNEADRGETIIEKLERCCRNTDFALILMTPDDFGFPKEKPDEIRPRARQNVVFELGYLAARLGRRRVRVLYKDVEIPTNYLGVLYIELDDEEKWRSYLARELKDAGILLNKTAEV